MVAFGSGPSSIIRLREGSTNLFTACGEQFPAFNEPCLNLRTFELGTAMFNLLADRFFPVVTRQGQRRWLSFVELADEGDNAPLEFDWPRADFNIAAFEFSVGVITLAFRPLSQSDWTRLWRSATSQSELSDAISPFRHAFELMGDGPRFLQELGGLEGEEKPIEALLIDSPGENGQRKNSDLLTHRNRYPRLGLPAAAMALYALQQFAPSGGAGNRTSLRGGGPMTTLVIPGTTKSGRPTLWRTLLANVVARQANAIDNDELPRALPWLSPTLLSDGSREVHEEGPDAHPLQCFFGMPRRIELKFGSSGRCPMTGEEGPCIERFVQNPWGVNYGLWRHPLTSYRRMKEGNPPFTVKPKSAQLGYPDWIAATVGGQESLLAEPSLNVREARRLRNALLRGDTGSDAILLAAGWVTDNMLALSYAFSRQPFHLARDPELQQILDGEAIRFAKAADEVATRLMYFLKDALFGQKAKTSTDAGVLNEARSLFYELTDNAFHAQLDRLMDSAPDDQARLAREWVNTLAKAAYDVYSEHAPAPIDSPERARRIATAFARLRSTMTGRGPAGKKIWNLLGLTLPETLTTAQGGENRAN
jgi:CRISPR system Cascade subunit CasA